MAIRLPSVAKQVLRQSIHAFKKAAPTSSNIPKGYCAVYVGEGQKKRFVVPISYLNQPVFQDLLVKAEEEYGFNHSMGGLTIPCREDMFVELTSGLHRI